MFASLPIATILLGNSPSGLMLCLIGLGLVLFANVLRQSSRVKQVTPPQLVPPPADAMSAFSR